MYDPCATYEISKKYRQLQNEYQVMNDAKLHLEFELKQKTENTNKCLNDLKSQNMDLTNELEEKNAIYEKLLADNSNLLHNLDERKKENEDFCKTAMNNEKEINLLNQEKSRCEQEACELDNTAKKNENSINNLCNQLDCLKIKNGKQSDELNRKNIELNNNTKSLNDLKVTNENLNNQINLKNASLDTVQNQLFQNEHCKRLQAEDDNIKLESILKDRDDTVNKLSSLNDALKSDRDKLINGKNNLLADVEKYKNHILVLTDQTEKLTSELERIISEDTELYNLNNSQIQRLQKVIYENKKLLQDEIQALNELENYIKCQPFSNCAQGSKNVGSPSRATYSRKEKY